MIIGLTGGIGSGKSTIGRIFTEEFNIPVYDSDLNAKRIIAENAQVKQEIIENFGENAFVSGKYNSKYVAEIVFNSKRKLKILNGIIHPKVKEDFLLWKENQQSDFVIQESAILFESNAYKHCDVIIGVISPLELRLERLQKRDQRPPEIIKNIILAQKSDAFIEKNSTFVIKNKDFYELTPQIKEIFFKILKIQNKSIDFMLKS